MLAAELLAFGAVVLEQQQLVAPVLVFEAWPLSVEF